MIRALLFVVTSIVALGCGPSAPTTPSRPPDLYVETPPIDVGWKTMVRDRQTLAAYSGRRVRFIVERRDCRIEGDVIRAWYGDIDVPHTLVVRSLSPVTGNGPFVIIGVCGVPVVDGVRRGRWIDYSVEVTAASVLPAR